MILAYLFNTNQSAIKQFSGVTIIIMLAFNILLIAKPLNSEQSKVIGKFSVNEVH
jgi:hypothetical protein